VLLNIETDITLEHSPSKSGLIIVVVFFYFTNTVLVDPVFSVSFQICSFFYSWLSGLYKLFYSMIYQRTVCSAVVSVLSF